MAFHPHYLGHPAPEQLPGLQLSGVESYEQVRGCPADWQRYQEQPQPEEKVKLDPQLRVVTKPGGILIFSAHICIPLSRTKQEKRCSV